MQRTSLFLAALPLLTTAFPFRLASIFGNGMVLQRNAPITIWGYSSPSTSVFAVLTDTATNSTFNASGVASSDGVWSVFFPPQASGYQWRLSVSDSPELPQCAQYPFFCEGAFAEISDVAFGDVLMCVGQSNMQVNVGFVFNATQELAEAAAFWGLIKVFQVQAAVAPTRAPLADFAVPPQIPWSPAGNSTLPEFSATCYFSAKSLLQARPAADRLVVLGLIAAPWGGAPIRAHAPMSVNATCGRLYPPDVSKQGCGMYHAPCAPAAIYNSMLAPISGAGAGLPPASRLPVAAFIWFQGAPVRRKTRATKTLRPNTESACALVNNRRKRRNERARVLPLRTCRARGVAARRARVPPCPLGHHLSSTLHGRRPPRAIPRHAVRNHRRGDSQRLLCVACRRRRPPVPYRLRSQPQQAAGGSPRGSGALRGALRRAGAPHARRRGAHLCGRRASRRAERRAYRGG